MKTKQWLKDNWFKIAAGVVVVGASFFLGWKIRPAYEKYTDIFARGLTPHPKGIFSTIGCALACTRYTYAIALSRIVAEKAIVLMG